MKKAAKRLIAKTGLLGPVQRTYFNLKTASPSVIYREVLYRSRGTPDGFALPPPQLIFDVISCRWAPVFLDSGALLIRDMNALLKRNGAGLEQFRSILDFGCGCGRLTRHLSLLDAVVHGTDYNPTLIEWCRKNLTFAHFRSNGSTPPLDYEKDGFDYIYARSVLTHLAEPLQRDWMRELHRILRPGGMLYITTHGRPLVGGLGDEQKAAFDAGKLVVSFPKAEGANLCASFESRTFVETELLHGFELIEFVEGREQDHLRQDIYLVRKT